MAKAFPRKALRVEVQIARLRRWSAPQARLVCAANAPGRIRTRRADEEISVSERLERPWALMRHHAGWADVFHIETESNDSITGFYPDRETVGPPVSYSVRAVLARFPTLEAARAAREGAVSEWRKHDAGVRDAETALRNAEKAREDAWLKCLRDAAER
jgi:hypothetical protein